MNHEIICGECPATYYPEEILAILGDEAVAKLSDLRPVKSKANGRSRSSGLARAFKSKQREPKRKKPDLSRFNDLRAYTFECPKGHAVDGNPGEPLGLAVLGGSGASKSHWLAAIVQEMDHLAALRKVGVRLENALYANPQLLTSATEVYDRERQLPPTPRGTLGGPFGAKLTIGCGPADPDAIKYAMQLFDVAGEDLAQISTIAECAKFIAMCRGLIILIDPVDYLATQFDEKPITERLRTTGGRAVKEGIRAIASTLTELYTVDSPRELEIPICFVIAKADAIQWTGEFDWRSQTEKIVTGTEEEGDLHAELLAASEEARSAFEQVGGELVIDEVEETFDSDYVRWVTASATSTMPALGQGPGTGDWVDPPEPRGVALSVLQVLDLAGVVPRAMVADSV